MLTISGLQKLCDILLEYPSWTIAHLVAYLNLTEHLNNPKVHEIIDLPDHETNMTPLQVTLIFDVRTVTVKIKQHFLQLVL